MLKREKSTGELIKQIRKSSGISQMELADKISVSYQQLQKYENGMTRLSLSRLRQISSALGVPVTRLLEEEDLPGPIEQKYAGLFNEDAKLLRLFRSIQSRKLKHGFIKVLEDAVRITSFRKAG